MDKKEPDIKSRDKILAAARSEFIRGGFNGARMQSIADAAGMNKALLHYYYKNKESLFELVFNDAFAEFIPKLHSIFSGEGSVLEKTEQYVEAHLSLLMEKPDLPLFVLTEIHRDPERFFEKFMNKLPGEPPFARFLQQIANEMREGKIRTMNPRELWMNVMSMTVFPFASRPMLQRLTLMADREFQELMSQRKQSIMLFIKLAIEIPVNN
ncbi:MAG: TetR/AcrR family transcriptional regulator [Bacteroidetes bacterium]|nr:TetR/AcrR family transcriptional regulator [Bacteroidota bacterium]